MKKKLFLLLIIFLLITGVVLAKLFFKWPVIKFSFKEDKKGSYEEGWNAAVQQYARSGIIPPPVRIQEAKEVGGKVVTINDSEIEILAEPTGVDPKPRKYIVNANSKTKVFRVVMKNEEQLDKEMMDFQDKVKKATEEGQELSLAAPSQTIKQEASFSDIQVESQIFVTSDEIIKPEELVKAVEILIL